MSQITRRQFLRNAGLTAGGLAVTALTGGAAAAYDCCFDRLPVTHHAVESAVLPSGFQMKIAFATDFHVNSYGVDLESLEGIVEQINASKPDLIMLGGDIQNNTWMNHNWFKPDPTPDEIARILARLNAPHGVYSVKGNHDQDKSGDAMPQALSNVGITTLENAFAPVTVKGVDFNVIGLPDFKTGWGRYGHDNPDFVDELYIQALDRPSLILSHDPITYRYLPPSAQALVQLSGHTHGGQIRIGDWSPYKPTPGTPDKWTYGKIDDEKGKAPLIVSSGIGTSRAAVRINAPTELVELAITGPVRPPAAFRL